MAVNNDAHCDFNRLRTMLVRYAPPLEPPELLTPCRTHMQDLKEITEEHLYEMFRKGVVCGRAAIIGPSHTSSAGEEP